MRLNILVYLAFITFAAFAKLKSNARSQNYFKNQVSKMMSTIKKAKIFT